MTTANGRAAPPSRSARLGMFFFQAEDGIRDWTVTGVQTCALPIFSFSSHNLTVTGVTISNATLPNSSSEGIVVSGISNRTVVITGNTIDGAGTYGISLDRKSTRLNSSHSQISYAVFCLNKKK